MTADAETKPRRRKDSGVDPIVWPDGGPLVVEDLSIEDFTGGAS